MIRPILITPALLFPEDNGTYPDDYPLVVPDFTMEAGLGLREMHGHEREHPQPADGDVRVP